MWKNKHEGASEKRKKGRSTDAASGGHKEVIGVTIKEWRVGVEYTRNDRVKVLADGRYGFVGGFIGAKRKMDQWVRRDTDFGRKSMNEISLGIRRAPAK
jgi:hypothetical protein